MMNSTSNEPEGSEKNDGIDRLTKLPNEILLHILSFLPLLDAVRTVCIRRFGNLWTLLPSLKFDDGDFSEPKYWPSIIIDSELPEEYIPSFLNFVRNVLIFHKRVILDKFMLSLNFPDYDGDYQSLLNDIRTWIRFALDRQVKDLSLNFYYGIDDVDFVLPRSIFSSPSLVVLHLSGLLIDEPSKVQLGSLKTLSLKYVEASNEVIKKIISGSPSLQRMDLTSVIGLHELRFTAPNIEELHLSSYCGLLDCPNLKILDVLLDGAYYSTHLELIDVSSVREVHIKLHDNLDVFYDLLKKFCNAEVFHYTDRYIQSSEYKEQDFPQTKWKRLHINSQLNGDQFLGICNVLKCSPHLEELIVYTNSLPSSNTHDDANVLSLELPSCLMQQLKTVTLRGYEVPCHGLLRLAEFLLKISVALEKLVILPSKRKSATVVDVLKFLKQLSSFPRASSNARVIVGSDCCTIMQEQDPEVLIWQC